MANPRASKEENWNRPNAQYRAAYQATTPATNSETIEIEKGFDCIFYQAECLKCGTGYLQRQSETGLIVRVKRIMLTPGK